MREIEALACKPVALQISLDRPAPEPNDAMRGPENFTRIIAAVPELGGGLDTDLLVTGAVQPLATQAEALAPIVAGRPPGEDGTLGIR